MVIIKGGHHTKERTKRTALKLQDTERGANNIKDIATTLFIIQLMLMVFICGRLIKDQEDKPVVVAEASLCFLIVEGIMLYMYLKYILAI